MDEQLKRSFNFMDNFPVLHDLVICKNISVHDKKGGNDNGFSNKAEYIRLEGERTTVLLDAIGPGCVKYFAAFWKNHQVLHPGFVERAQLKKLGSVNFHFDGEKRPRVRSLLDKFVGKPPRAYPLALTAQESTGTTLSYQPMPFRDSLLVRQDGGKTPAFGLHFWYHLYPPGTPVDTWTEEDDLGGVPHQLHPETAWTPAGQTVLDLENIPIPAGETKEIFRADKAGTIKCIRMKVPEKDKALRNLILTAWWDNDKVPSIEAPLSILFAIENRFPRDPERKRARDLHVEIKGVIIGQDPEGFFFFRLPMPFNERARVVIENRNQTDQIIPHLRLESDEGATEGLGRTAGYLRTQFRENRNLVPGRDVLLLEAKGRGKLAGVVLAVEDTPECFLEGDERIYIEGGRTPAIIGDATETFFNGSWYFLDRAFACPLHGAPSFRLESYVSMNLRSDITMYRFMPLEFVPFRGAIRFSIQHGGFNEVLGHYRSLVFYYHLPEPSLVKTDFIAMPSPRVSPPPKTMEKKSGFFEGEFCGNDIGTIKKPSFIPQIWWMAYWTLYAGNRREAPENSPDKVSFTVATHDAPHEFKVKIDPEADAVILRRVLDQSVFDQRARVEVDGEFAATWFNTGNNEWKIFAEDDIFLRPETTRGKSKIAIRIVPDSGSFTVAEYTVFSITVPKRN